MLVSDNKSVNLKKAEELINRCVAQGAELVVLPEMFNCPYDNSYFPKFAESCSNGETIEFLSDIASKKQIYLVGGSIPEKDESGNIYNTSFVFDREGNMIAKHRKMHLFDINVEGGITFKESDILSYGNDITIFDTEYGKMGIAICYDIRFPELSRLMAMKGAKIAIIPAAFNMTTGPAHWELLFRARALDNQIYMIGCAPARNLDANYNSYGNSIITDPWGSVIGRLEEEERVLVKDIELGKIDKIRGELPLLKHRREDVYNIREL